jgi:hypothetical protein
MGLFDAYDANNEEDRKNIRGLSVRIQMYVPSTVSLVMIKKD